MNFKAFDEDICRFSKFGRKSHACYGALVLQKKKVTFCSGAKVASTTIKDFFYQIADGEYVKPEGILYAVHKIEWKRLCELEYETQKEILNDESGSWVNVFFMKNVVDRFVSGYLDKVVKECNKMDKKRKNQPRAHQPYAAMYHYKKFGFSCDTHQDFETFVNFMVDLEEENMEGHFFSQTVLCDVRRFPYTDIIFVDQDFSSRLETLAMKEGWVDLYKPNHRTKTHSTRSHEKMVELFKGKRYLLDRILDLFHPDCRVFPAACNVDELVAKLEMAEQTEQQMEEPTGEADNQ